MPILVHPFADLPAPLAYSVWRLRQQVFVLEQECLYPDLDGRDAEPGTQHVLLTSETGELAGYARVLDDGATWRIGRVVLTPSARGQGLADGLVRAAVDAAVGHDPGRDLVLDAQSPLVDWYAGFGFATDGPEFLDDGIPHTPMRRPATHPRP